MGTSQAVDIALATRRNAFVFTEVPDEWEYVSPNGLRYYLYTLPSGIPMNQSLMESCVSAALEYRNQYYAEYGYYPTRELYPARPLGVHGDFQLSLVGYRDSW